MYGLVSFILNNMPLIIVCIIGYIIYKTYKELKEYVTKINYNFEKTLRKYLDEKIKTAREETEQILNEYNREDECATEIQRLLAIIEKCETGTINEKVNASNAVNKFKVAKKIVEKYPNLDKLNNMKTFTEEEIESKDNGLALARSEYNTLAYRYNEKSSGFVAQFLCKLFKFPIRYVIFDALESQKYEQNFEVFEEKEKVEVGSLDMLNLGEKTTIDLNEIKNTAKREDLRIDHASDILKPSYTVEKLEEEEQYIEEDTR